MVFKPRPWRLDPITILGHQVEQAGRLGHRSGLSDLEEGRGADPGRTWKLETRAEKVTGRPDDFLALAKFWKGVEGVLQGRPVVRVLDGHLFADGHDRGLEGGQGRQVMESGLFARGLADHDLLLAEAPFVADLSQENLALDLASALLLALEVVDGNELLYKLLSGRPRARIHLKCKML